MAKKSAAPRVLRPLSRAELSEISGLSNRRHEQLAAEGYFAQPTRGAYAVIPTLQGLLRYYRERAEQARTPLVQIAERKAETEARIAALKLAREERTSVPKAHIAPAAKRIVAAAKAQLYQSLVTDLSLRLEGKPLAERRAMLRATADDICDVLAGLRDAAESTDPADATPP